MRIRIRVVVCRQVNLSPLDKEFWIKDDTKVGKLKDDEKVLYLLLLLLLYYLYFCGLCCCCYFSC